MKTFPGSSTPFYMLCPEGVIYTLDTEEKKTRKSVLRRYVYVLKYAKKLTNLINH